MKFIPVGHPNSRNNPKYEVTNEKITTQSAEEIVNTLNPASIHKWAIDDCAIDNDVIQVLTKEIKVNKSLKIVFLRSDISEVSIKALAEALKINTSLKSTLTNKGAQAFSEALDVNSSLTILSLLPLSTEIQGSMLEDIQKKLTKEQRHERKSIYSLGSQ